MLPFVFEELLTKTMVPLRALIWIVCVIITCLATTTASDITTRKQVIKQKCQYDRDCPRHAFCQAQKECACKEGYFIHKEENRNEICLKRVASAGDMCRDDAQCQLALGPSAECRPVYLDDRTHECACREYAHLVDGRCYNTSRVGEKCAGKNNCLMEGGPILSCVNGVCICPRNQHPSADRSQCIEDRRLSEECYHDEECVPQNSRCTDICVCRMHYIANEWGRECVPVADSVGDPCELQKQCETVPHAICVDNTGTCECESGYHPGPHGMICWRDAFLGEDCDEHPECIGVQIPLEVPYNTTRAECHEHKCRCAEGYRPDSRGKLCEYNAGTRTTLASVLLLAVVVAATPFRT